METYTIGDLIQTLLIQVQKTKVDVDLAMAALDKLLKSNELNFAFLGKMGTATDDFFIGNANIFLAAVAPSMLLTWGTVAWLRRCYDQRTGQRIGKTGLPMRQAIRYMFKTKCAIIPRLNFFFYFIKQTPRKIIDTLLQQRK